MSEFIDRVDLTKLIGLKVVSVHKGRDGSFPEDKTYLLFDDEKTLLTLSEQDYYEYHDCSYSARELFLEQDEIEWKKKSELPLADAYHLNKLD